MRLSRRENIMLAVLAVIVVGFGYHKFVLVPQLSSAAKLKRERNEKRQELETLKTDIASQHKLKLELLKLQSKLDNESQDYFLTLDQEEIIIILKELTQDLDITIQDMTFEEPRQEAIGLSEEDEDNEPKMDVHTVTIEYEAEYYSLLDFLTNIATYPQKIMMENININKDESAKIKANTTLKFYSVGKVLEIEDFHIVWEPDQGGLIGNPFLEFNGYIIPKQDDDSEEDSSSESLASRDLPENFKSSSFSSTNIKINDSKTYGPDVSTGSSNGDRNNYGAPNIDKYKKIFTFDSIENLIFIGNHKDVKGNLSLNNDQKVEGKSSVNFDYDFVEKRKHNMVNIFFNNKLKINKKAESLSLSLRPIEISSAALGIIVRDIEGESYKLEITNDLDWTGWKKINIDLPIDINYPATVERIYIETENYYNKLTGNLLIDDLRIYKNH